MCVGEKKRLVIPPELAWGKDGLPDYVNGETTVIFMLELLKIEDGNVADERTGGASNGQSQIPIIKEL